jgi:beta-glucuronidase
MIRLFEQHVVRRQQELDGLWEFVREDGKHYRLMVPGCWEQHPDMKNYRGAGTYLKKVTVTETTDLRLEFKGVSHTADIYFDDIFVAHHYNAFTPFSGLVKAVSPGEHTIRAEVHNRFDEASALHIPNDYYTYGGIVRPVVMEYVNNTYVERVSFRPVREETANGEASWKAEITAWIRNTGEQAEAISVSGELAGQTICEQQKMVEAGSEAILHWTMSFADINEWNPENPNLYMLKLWLKKEGRICDDYQERVGFRTIESKNQKLYLNGKPIFLKGFNRHEDYGVIGCAIPPQLMVQDMEILQDMGANAVRTCHYPNDERFLDLCDERGILVWEENHARGLGLKEMQNPNFERQCADCIEEMIKNHVNHPSIIIWGILNECASETPEGREMYQKQYAQIKNLDDSRLTTSATCRHFKDICLDLPDIVSFNMYAGWYEDVPVKERHDQEMDWIQASGGAEKPIIVSEFGAAAMYGFRDRGHCKWSEERQEDIIRENLETFQKDDRLSGVFIWQYADCRVTEEGGWFASRARCHNNKGILDEYRRPKQAYDMIKEMFAKM